MFQYATGLAVARRLGVEYKLDLTPFEGRYTLHPYGLSHLNIEAQPASRQEIMRLRNRRLKSLPKFMRPTLERRNTHYRNLSLHFDPQVLSLPDPVYLEGYFQSERYFNAIEEDIRVEFMFKTPPSEANREMAERIKNTKGATAVHVRRADYVSDETTNALHGTCSPHYYKKAMHMLYDRERDVSAFVFSDDPNWAEQNLELNVPMCVVRLNAAEKGYEDLRLMSLCRHFIIANSSFSWWGAWLGNRENKCVLAPENWMRDPQLNSPDVYPADWIKVNA